MMLQYAESSSCRRKFILNYFGRVLRRSALRLVRQLPPGGGRARSPVYRGSAAGHVHISDWSCIPSSASVRFERYRARSRHRALFEPRLQDVAGQRRASVGAPPRSPLEETGRRAPVHPTPSSPPRREEADGPGLCHGCTSAVRDHRPAKRPPRRHPSRRRPNRRRIFRRRLRKPPRRPRRRLQSSFLPKAATSPSALRRY